VRSIWKRRCGLNAEDPVGYVEDVAAIFDASVRRCQRRGRFRGNPVYHVALNWQQGEHPTAAQADRSCRQVMKALGFEDCSAVWGVHRDTEHDHVHLVINRVHPTKFTARSVPWHDFLILDRVMRELEFELGFGRAQGPYVTLDTSDGPKIIRMSRKEREGRGLLKDPDAPRISVRAQRAEQNLNGASFQRWLTGAPASALHALVQARDASWQGVHDALARFDCTMQPKGSGLVVTTTLSTGRVLAAKASLMGRWAGKASLERTLGPYEAPSEPRDGRLTPQSKTYEQFMMRQRLADAGPRLGDDDSKRLARRAARADARRKLAERFALEQAQARAERTRQRQTLRERHERERRALFEAHREQRGKVRVAARAQRADGRLALSLWAFRAAAHREAMQRRHGNERRALTQQLPRSEVWRRWLERQALAGDEAAKAALRGIRYRAQRNRQREDAIEGEEATEQLIFTVASLRAEIDAARLVVIYRRADGVEAFRDTGPRIVMRDRSDASLEAALRVAAQKYAGHVQVTGCEPFRERAARMATRLGIAVENAELQTIVSEERQRIAAVVMGTRARQMWPERRRPPQWQSRSMER
jgi:MobA/VirD2-like, nuclease domain/Large polyvalent protein-associated domain 7/TraI-like middle domain